MACRFTELIVDCRDPRRVADFWASVLGYRETEDSEPDCIELRGADRTGPALLFLRVPEPKTGKNRLHIDVNPTDRDQPAEVDRILALGARPADVGQGEQTWVVLADPEGNEFCVLRSRVGP